MFCCKFDRKVWLTLLTGYNGEVWVLGRVLFDLSYSLELSIILIQLEGRYGTWVDIYRSLPIIASTFILWFQHTLIYNMRCQHWKSISHSYSHALFWRMNQYACNLISSRYKLETVPSRPVFFYLSGNFSSGIARFC